MALFSNKANGGVMDVIRCDEQNYLVWKWRPQGAELGESKKENAIRWGSSLRVKEGSVAVFVYSSDNGTVQDYIVGPADTIIDTKNLPVISSIIGLAYAGGSPFQAEVYFINLASTIQMKFAVPYFDVYDSELNEFSVPIAVRGSFDFSIEDYIEFIKKHRLDNFSLTDLKSQVRDTVSENVKSVVANAPDSYQIPVIHLEKKVTEIKATLLDLLTKKLFDSYGVTLKDVNLAAIDIDKDSEGYRELKAVTKDLTAKDRIAGQKMGVFGKAAEMFVDIKEGQFVRHKQSEREYADVIEDKRAGKAGAVIGKVFRSVRGDKGKGKDVPPAIPSAIMYNVAVNGEATGPFDLNTLERMAREKRLTKDSLVWTKGMEEWEKAGTVADLKDFFVEMPDIPKE